MSRILLIIALTCLIDVNKNILFSQDHTENQTLTEKTHKYKNDLAGFVGATYIFESGFVLPTVGIEYVRKLNSHLGIGIITEFEIGSHIISTNEANHEEIDVERSSAILALPSIYYMIGHFAFSAGYGIEFENSENLGLFKLTINYALELKNEDWIVLPNVSWDHTSVFDGFVYGFSIARRF